MYTIYTPGKVFKTSSKKEFEDFCSMFEPITACGGLVRNADGKYLMIRRKGFWDLPKGKLEESESLEECALREVNEETGLQGLICGRPICITHHTYNTYGPLNIKHTHWFEMSCTGPDETVPQKEEDISEAVWLTKEEALARMDESYASIREVLETALL